MKPHIRRFSPKTRIDLGADNGGVELEVLPVLDASHDLARQTCHVLEVLSIQRLRVGLLQGC